MSIGIITGVIALVGLGYQIYRDTKNHKSNEEKIDVIIKHLPEVVEDINAIHKAKGFRK